MSDSTPRPPSVAKDSHQGALAWMANNSVAANLLMIALLCGGIMMVPKIKQEVFPEVELDVLGIQVAYPGASPSEVEQGVILAIEEAVRGIDGLKEINSVANEGMATVSIELLLGTNKDRVLSDVKSAVDRISSFPKDVERPVISYPTNRAQVITLVLHGDVDEHLLRHTANETRDALLQRDGVTYAELSGARPLEISIDVPQRELRRHGLRLEQVASAVRQASVDVPGGGVKTTGGEVLLRTTEQRQQRDEFANIALRSAPDGTSLRIGDIATIHDGFQDNEREFRYNGKRAIAINVFRVDDSETPISVTDEVRAFIANYRDQLPEGIDIDTWLDSSEMYRGRVNLLLRNAAVGLTLVLLILGLFLEPKLAFWVTLGIPISFIGALVFMPASDVSINMISLFAFIVTLGMVVDDAIVVGEAVYKERQDGKAPLQAAINGVRSVAVPVTFSIVTTCIAFTPMLFVPGPAGKFFRVIPIVVILVLLISLVESLLVLPAHLASLKSSPQGLLGRLYRSQARFSHTFENFINQRYRPFVNTCIRARYITCAVGIALLIASIGLVAGGRVEFTFLPKIDGDIVTAKLEMPFGTAAHITQKHVRTLLDKAAEVDRSYSNKGDALVRGVFSKMGIIQIIDGGPSNTGANSGSHVAMAQIYLVGNEKRDISAGEFARQWRDKVGEIPGAETLSFEYSVGASAGAPINYRLRHPDPQELERAATEFAKILQNYEGVIDIDDGFAPGKEQLDFTLKPEARAFGLTESDLATQVRAAFFGIEAARQQRGRDEVRVYVRYPDEERRSLRSIEQMVLQTPSGTEIPLSQAAHIKRGRAFTEIKRTDGNRIVEVTANVDEQRANANVIAAKLTKEELPKLMQLFPGLTYSLGGEQKEQGETLQALGSGFAMALIAMFALLAVAFRSYIQPVIVMSAIPFGMVGALIGHVLMGYSLSLMSMMGLVALSGVVVNDSLILIVAINEYRREMPLVQAIIEGGCRRFRPILLTSLTTFFGLTPMILETSTQARFLIPMAISLGFGVLGATFITLILVPAGYSVIEDIKGLFVKSSSDAHPPASAAPFEGTPSPTA